MAKKMIAEADGRLKPGEQVKEHLEILEWDL
jgi:hypothetical protein